MIGLDTNLLIRYLTQDDPVQSARATRVIERELGGRQRGFISIVAMVETAWVLKRAYGFSDVEIAAGLERLLQIDTLEVEHEQDVFNSMIALKEGHGTFADALIAARGARAGCSRTLTFDRKALRLPGFELA